MVGFEAVRFRVCNDRPHVFKDEKGVVHEHFWNEFSNAKWEADTLALVARLARAGAPSLYDFGAWIGPLSLYAAALGLKVVAVEPDPVAFAHLFKNSVVSGLHDRIELISGALLCKNAGKLLRLYSDSLGDSETSVASARMRAECLQIIVSSYISAGITLQDLLNVYPVKDGAILKFDIEGAEFELMDDIADAVKIAPVTLLLSVHPENITSPEYCDPSTMIEAKRRSMLSSVSKLNRQGRYYWRAMTWRYGDYFDLMNEVRCRGELIKMIVASSVDLRSTLLSA